MRSLWLRLVDPGGRLDAEEDTLDVGDSILNPLAVSSISPRSSFAFSSIGLKKWRG